MEPVAEETKENQTDHKAPVIAETKENPKNQEPSEAEIVDVDAGEDSKTGANADASLTNKDNGFNVVSNNGKVRWEFIITADTINDEIEKTKTSKLLHAVAGVEKQLGLNFQI